MNADRLLMIIEYSIQQKGCCDVTMKTVINAFDLSVWLFSKYKFIKWCRKWQLNFELLNPTMIRIKRGNSVDKMKLGTVNENIVKNDFLKKNYDIFESITQNSLCDFIVMNNTGNIISVEVTKGKVTGEGKIYYVQHLNKKFDVLAIVDDDSKIYYYSKDKNNGLKFGIKIFDDSEMHKIPE